MSARRCDGEILAQIATGCRNGSKGVLDRDPGDGPESRLWDAVVEQGQEPERLD